mgnify:CR=1 FL=1
MKLIDRTIPFGYLQAANITLALLCFLILLPGPALSQSTNADFEGIINYTIPADSYSNDRAAQQFKYMAKGNQGRIEFEMEGGRQMALLVDSKQRNVTMLMPQAQAYMEFPMNRQENKTESDSREGKEPKLQKIDESQVIAGKKCQLWRVEDEEQTVDIWVANGMGNFLLPGTEVPGQMGPLQMQDRPEWLDEAIQKGFMPLKLEVTENGKTRTVLEAQSVEEKSLSASLFTVPSGYQNMNQMMRQMMQGQGK